MFITLWESLAFSGRYSKCFVLSYWKLKSWRRSTFVFADVMGSDYSSLDFVKHEAWAPIGFKVQGWSLSSQTRLLGKYCWRKGFHFKLNIHCLSHFYYRTAWTATKKLISRNLTSIYAQEENRMTVNCYFMFQRICGCYLWFSLLPHRTQMSKGWILLSTVEFVEYKRENGHHNGC